jgi:hypothetical protein
MSDHRNSSATHPTPYVVRGVGSRQAPIQHAKNLSQGKYDEHHIRPTTPKFRVSVPSLVPSSTVLELPSTSGHSRCKTTPSTCKKCRTWHYAVCRALALVVSPCMPTHTMPYVHHLRWSAPACPQALVVSPCMLTHTMPYVHHLRWSAPARPHGLAHSCSMGEQILGNARGH